MTNNPLNTGEGPFPQGTPNPLPSMIAVFLLVIACLCLALATGRNDPGPASKSIPGKVP